MAIGDGGMSLGRGRWVCDWGEFDVPPCVLALMNYALRRDGWFDKRKGTAKELELYFGTQEQFYALAFYNENTENFKAQTWQEYLDMPKGRSPRRRWWQ